MVGDADGYAGAREAVSRLILVLGMHRSGTSLVAASLRCLGVRFGPRANWWGPDNPTGFNEDLDVLAIDEALLKAAGTAWDRPDEIKWGDWCEPWKAPAIALLKSRLAAFPLFGLKDPRMCRLLPFWRPVFEAVGCEVSVVLVRRDFDAIAASLAARNGIALEPAHVLSWFYYRHAGMGVDRTWELTTVAYDHLVATPLPVIHGLSERLDLPINCDALTRFLRDTLDLSLRHHVSENIQREIIG